MGFFALFAKVVSELRELSLNQPAWSSFNPCCFSKSLRSANSARMAAFSCHSGAISSLTIARLNLVRHLVRSLCGTRSLVARKSVRTAKMPTPKVIRIMASTDQCEQCHERNSSGCASFETFSRRGQLRLVALASSAFRHAEPRGKAR